MGNRVIKSWFLARVRYNVEMTHIVYADSEVEVRFCFVGCVKMLEIRQLSWQEVSDLTGCIIPSMFEPSMNATGDLMFYHNNKSFVLTNYESAGG